MNLNKYKYIMFDADNTILDFNKSQEISLKNTFEKYNIKFNKENINLYHKISHDLWGLLEMGRISVEDIKTERFNRLKNELDIELDVYEISDFYLETLSKTDHMRDGAYSVCKKLSKSFKLYLASNGFYDVQIKRMKNSGLSEFFNGFFISEKLGYSKPDMRFFEKAVEILGCPLKNEILMIGDSESSDIKGANNFGIDSCLICSDKNIKSNANFKIEKLEELFGEGGL